MKAPALILALLCTTAQADKDVIALSIAPGVDFRPAIAGLSQKQRPILRLSFVPALGDGASAVHLTTRWEF